MKWIHNSVAALIGIGPVFLTPTMSAQASLVDQYSCDAGDIGYLVTLDPRQPEFVAVEVSVSEMMDQSLARTFDLPEVPAGSGFAYEADTVRFSGKGILASIEIDGDVIGCEFFGEEEQTHADGAVGGNESSILNTPGQSLGGRLRDGPGTNFSAVGSLAEGTPVTIVRNTGVQMNGYDWFELSVDGRIAYQWGGIMCSNGSTLAGIYTTCTTSPKQASGGSDQPEPNSNNWMVFAIDFSGMIGHGAGATIARAQDYALGYCQGTNCQIVDQPVQSRCHSIADSQSGGYWFGIGAAETVGEADRLAVQYCRANTKRNCQVRYNFCQ